MASYAINSMPSSGLVLNTLLDAAPVPANGDDVPTGDRYVLVARNTDAATRTITFVTPGFADGDLTIQDRAGVAVPATSGLAMFPLRDVYRDSATGRGTLTFSATANLKCIVVVI